MSGHIIEIPQTKGKASIWDQRLKVAASCRISTDHEDQKQSLENQVAFYTNYVRRNPYMCAAFDQAESQERSDNIKFGIRQRMRSGKVLLNHSQFLGYTKGTDGVLRVVPEEAEIVRKIFALYLQGNGVRKIKRYLEEHGIKTVTGKSEWSTSTIDRMLSNEKYIGRLLMQKTYTPDFLTGKQIRNQEDLDMYFIEDAHEAIIDKETFEKVQARKKHAAK